MGGERPKRVYFLTIDKAKFRKPVVPGDTVEYHMRKIRPKEEHVVVSRRGESGGASGRRGRSGCHGGVRSAMPTIASVRVLLVAGRPRISSAA